MGLVLDFKEGKPSVKGAVKKKLNILHLPTGPGWPPSILPRIIDNPYIEPSWICPFHARHNNLYHKIIAPRRLCMLFRFGFQTLSQVYTF